MITGFLPAAGFSLEATAGGDVGLLTADWFDAAIPGLLIKLPRPVEIAMIRQGQGAHAEFAGPGEKPVNRPLAIKKTKVTVTVKMHKRWCRHRLRPPSFWAEPICQRFRDCNALTL